MFDSQEKIKKNIFNYHFMKICLQKTLTTYCNDVLFIKNT